MSSTKQSNYYLIDCNQFYVSCEQVFNPKLKDQPVVVLSNNDGCIVARSKQAKALNIPMGAPFYQYAELFKKKRVFVCSSNYALYGDLSQRVMSVLSRFSPHFEEYSIDEAFLLLESEDPLKIAQEIQQTVLKWTGIPVSIGIGPTKTLAKVANDIAKNTPSSQGIFAFKDKEHIDAILKTLPVQDIWGVGPRLSKTLNAAGIRHAGAFKEAPDLWIKQQGSVTLLRTAWELRSIPCLSLQELPVPRLSITRSRSFGKPTSDWNDLAEALCSYAATALSDLRSEHLLPSFLTVFLMTSAFIKEAYHNSITLTLTEPTSYTPTVTSAAKDGLRKIYRKGYLYKKVGIILGGLLAEGSYQPDLFSSPTKNTAKQAKAMQLCDTINQRYQNKALRFASEGIAQSWQMQRCNVSPRFTTAWKELLTIRI
ncbi:MAG: Y-family DNA polymerase [Rhabdochlamydiaceae bacterium]|nr:Y-family DNA polymerase [Rhabdochlamydiaceae bacterium]